MANGLEFEIAVPTGTFSYTYAGDRRMMVDYAQSMDFYEGGTMHLPQPVGLRGLLYGRRDGPAEFVIGGDSVKAGPTMTEGDVLAAVLTLKDMHPAWMDMTPESRLEMVRSGMQENEGRLPDMYQWFVTDVLAKEGIDQSKVGTEQRLNNLRRGGPLRLLAFKVGQDESDKFADVIDKQLRKFGIESVVTKGANATYYDSQFAFPGAVTANLTLHRQEGRTVGYPEAYTKNDVPWLVTGVPQDFEAGKVANVIFTSESQALFNEPTTENATSKQTIRGRMERAGLMQGDQKSDEFAAESASVGI